MMSCVRELMPSFSRRYLPQNETHTHSNYAVMLQLSHEHTPITGVCPGKIPTVRATFIRPKGDVNSSLRSSYWNAKEPFKCDVVLK